MRLSPKQLAEIMPRCPAPQLDAYAEALSTTMTEKGLTTVVRAGVFLGQIAWESNQLVSWEENLNYSAEQIVRTWPRKFTAEAAAYLAHNPEGLANAAYGGRLGNGPRESGDGWRYRGRGPLMWTGKDNYAALGKLLGEDLVQYPERLLVPAVGFKGAVLDFCKRGIIEKADALDLAGVTRAINGAATIGAPSYHERRLDLMQRAVLVLGRAATLA